MQRSTRRTLACALIAACLPSTLAGSRAAPVAAPRTSLLAAPVRAATGPAGSPARPASGPTIRLPGTPPWPGRRRPAGTRTLPGARIATTVPIPALRW